MKLQLGPFRIRVNEPDEEGSTEVEDVAKSVDAASLYKKSWQVYLFKSGAMRPKQLELLLLHEMRDRINTLDLELKKINDFLEKVQQHWNWPIDKEERK